MGGGINETSFNLLYIACYYKQHTIIGVFWVALLAYEVFSSAYDRLGKVA